MDNASAFQVSQYDENVRKVIPYYDDIYRQIFSLIRTYFGETPIAVLDTGCGTGTFGAAAHQHLLLRELVLCDPSETMLRDAQKKLGTLPCEFFRIGSEQLAFENRFDVVTAIQSHHYFDRPTREAAVRNCFRALKPEGLLFCFENTAPDTDIGTRITLQRLEAFEREAGRSPEEIKAHTARYNSEFFPITRQEHLELFRRTGFRAAELLWHSYLQSGFYAVK